MPAKLCAVDPLLKAYFDPSPPFEAAGGKKSEFPDALALMSLEEWARTSNRTILAASADKGWAAYAATSPHITVEADLGAALQIVQNHTDAAAAAIETLLRRITAGELPDAAASLEAGLADALVDWDFEVEAASSYRFETGGTELRLDGYELAERDGAYDVTIVRLTAEETVVRVEMEVTATASANFSLFIWDSIDREDVGMGSTSASSEATFDAAVLITICGAIDMPSSDLAIEEVEVVEALGSVDLGEVDLDYGERDDADDYDQLQLMLGGEAAGDLDGPSPTSSGLPTAEP